MHLAALHHAVNRSDDALSTLDGVEGKMAEDDLDLVSVLHARADVLDSSGKPLASSRSGRPMDAANAAMNLARVLRQWRQLRGAPGPPAAGKASTASAKARRRSISSGT